MPPRASIAGNGSPSFKISGLIWVVVIIALIDGPGFEIVDIYAIILNFCDRYDGGQGGRCLAIELCLLHSYGTL